MPERFDGYPLGLRAVQVPDPFVKRVLAEAIKEMLRFARENKVPIGFKDLGAGGIACAFSEMPEDLKHATVAIEDKDFYHHSDRLVRLVFPRSNLHQCNCR